MTEKDDIPETQKDPAEFIAVTIRIRRGTWIEANARAVNHEIVVCDYIERATLDRLAAGL